jgi:hypothetical protein
VGRLILLWSLAALALARSRVPYDDEWFSIELAFDTTPGQFWFALDDDVHPPWLALLDRSIGTLWSQPIALQGLRIAASALAIALVARALSKPMQLPGWAFVLAACHPIVLFYAGSARWYPCLFLAHALRLFAIWSERPLSRAGAFLAGALLGPVAGYLDVLFLAHDGAWFARRARRSGAAWIPLGALAFAAVGCALLPLLASPLHGRAHALALRWPHWDPTGVAIWAGLGLAGETALPWPLLLLGLACGFSSAWALASALFARDSRSRELAAFILSYAAVWLLACGFGVWHPRYSLLLWLLCLALVWSQWSRAGRVVGSLNALSALHLFAALALAVAGFGFLKSDLNRMMESDCQQLRAAETASVLIVPYRRLAQLGKRQCHLHAPLLTIPSIRVTRTEAEQLSGLRRALEQPGDYWLLALDTDSTLAVTQDRVRGVLQERCSAEAAKRFGQIPHPGLTPQRTSAYRRFSLQRFRCAQAHN